MQDKHVIVGVHVTNRVRHAGEVQQVFTDHGEVIKTRLGLTDLNGGKAGPSGMIILEMVGTDAQTDDLVKKLKAIEGVEVQTMVFHHH